MKTTRCSLALATCCALLAAPRDARADDTIKHPGDHITYGVEIEPHVLAGWANDYGAGGFGLGARFSIPVVQNGFVPSINNSVAVSFGADLLWYNDCNLGLTSCGAEYLQLPVALQWNFFVAQRWSVFGEPGLEIYHGFVPGCAHANCDGPTVTGVLPALWVGGRYHLNETMALTLRVGFPAISFGVSFFP